MPERIPQSTTLRVPLKAYLSSDGKTPATGKTIAITISKNGGAYGNPSGGATNATAIASGSYYVDLSTTDTGTLGPLFVLGTEGTIDQIDAIYNVVVATGATVDANLVSILGTTLTETVAGYLTAGFKKFFDVATPVLTAASVNQTGDNYARLGAPAGASVSADIAAVASSVTTVLARIGAFTGTGLNTLLGFLRAIMRADSAITPSDVGGTYDNTTKSLEAISVAAGGGLTESDVRDAVGLATNNLDAQLAGIQGDITTMQGDVTTLLAGVPVVGSVIVGGYDTGQDPNSLWAAGAMEPCVGLPDTHGKALTYVVQQRKNKEKADKLGNALILYEDDGTTTKHSQSLINNTSEATRGAV